MDKYIFLSTILKKYNKGIFFKKIIEKSSLKHVKFCKKFPIRIIENIFIFTNKNIMQNFILGEEYE